MGDDLRRPPATARPGQDAAPPRCRGARPAASVGPTIRTPRSLGEEDVMSAPGRDLRETAADLIDAFNQADWERFRSRLAPDIVYVETGTGRRLEGADAYVDACRAWRTALPDVHGTVLAELAGENLVAQELQ